MTCPRCDGSGIDDDLVRILFWRVAPTTTIRELKRMARCRLCQGTGWREIGGEG